MPVDGIPLWDFYCEMRPKPPIEKRNKMTTQIIEEAVVAEVAEVTVNRCPIVIDKHGTWKVDTDMGNGEPYTQTNAEALYSIRDYAERMYNGMWCPLYKVVSGYLVIEDLEWIQSHINSYEFEEEKEEECECEEDDEECDCEEKAEKKRKEDEEWDHIVMIAQEAINELVSRYQPVLNDLRVSQELEEEKKAEEERLYWIQINDASKNDPSIVAQSLAEGNITLDPDMFDEVVREQPCFDSDDWADGVDPDDLW
jgi:hypothetical protein